MDSEQLRFALIIFAFGFSFGVLKSAFGIAAVLLTPLLAFLIPAKLAIAVLGPILLVGDGLATRANWGRWDKTVVMRMLPFTCIGTFIGAFILAGLSLGYVNKILAVCVWFYALLQWLLSRKERISALGRILGTPFAGVLLGFAAGLIGSLSNASAVLLAPHLLASGLEGQRFVATVVPIFFAQGLTRIPAYLLSGVVTLKALSVAAATAPFVYLGIRLGQVLAERTSLTTFRLVLQVVMVGTGVLLFIR